MAFKAPVRVESAGKRELHIHESTALKLSVIVLVGVKRDILVDAAIEAKRRIGRSGFGKEEMF